MPQDMAPARGDPTPESSEISAVDVGTAVYSRDGNNSDKYVLTVLLKLVHNLCADDEIVKDSHSNHVQGQRTRERPLHVLRQVGMAKNHSKNLNQHLRRVLCST
jgi:hypothetical protein